MNDIKRGYPNPNYTEEDVMTEEEAILEEVGLVTLPVDHYEMLVSKAAALDILTADLKRRGSVNDDIVLAVTGAIPDHEIQEALKDKDQAWGFYWKEKEQKEALEARCAMLEMENKKQAELLEQLIEPEEVKKDE